MFSFKKRRNKKLEKFLKESHIELQDIQTYVPIFDKLKTKKRRFYKNLKIKLDHEIYLKMRDLYKILLINSITR